MTRNQCPERQRSHRRETPRTIFAAAVALAAGGLGAWGGIAASGCGTIDNGDPPADVNACRPSQQFFYERICPEYLAMSYGGKTCMDSGCHDTKTTSFFKITLTSCTQDAPPTVPFVGGSPWLDSYISATKAMNCTDVDGAALYTRPSGQAAHGGGKLFEPGGPEFSLLQEWVMPP